MFVRGIKEVPHPEEPAQPASRTAHSARPTCLASPLSRDEAGAVSKLRGAFENIADPQHHLLIEGAADDLQAERQPVRAEPRRQR